MVAFCGDGAQAVPDVGGLSEFIQGHVLHTSLIMSGCERRIVFHKSNQFQCGNVGVRSACRFALESRWLKVSQGKCGYGASGF